MMDFGTRRVLNKDYLLCSYIGHLYTVIKLPDSEDSWFRIGAWMLIAWWITTKSHFTTNESLPSSFPLVTLNHKYFLLNSMHYVTFPLHHLNHFNLVNSSQWHISRGTNHLPETNIIIQIDFVVFLYTLAQYRTQHLRHTNIRK